MHFLKKFILRTLYKQIYTYDDDNDDDDDDDELF